MYVHVCSGRQGYFRICFSWFYAPRSNIWGGGVLFCFIHVWFLLFVILYFKLATYFWTVSARVLIIHLSISSDRTIKFLSSHLDLGVCLVFENFNRFNNFPIVSAVNSYIFTLSTYLGVWPFFFKKKTPNHFILANHFKTVSARAFIFPKSISSGKSCR